MTLPFAQESYTVSELCVEIAEYLGTAFASVWVVGEIQRVRRSQRRHLYFELVEKGEGDEIVGKLDAVAWRSDHDRIRRLLAAGGQEIRDGLEIRCRGNVDFYPPAGRLQLVVREVDPSFSLGLLERRRQETLEALKAAGLLERNKGLTLPDVPLRLALITSQGSAAYHDFLTTLSESDYGFQIVLLHASVQGLEAEAQIVSALGSLGALGVDCAVVVRGGGSRSDLAVFDSRRVAEAVAMAPVPVLTGLGHEIDLAISDLVAHTALKTPTKAAEFLVQQRQRAEQRYEQLRQALCREALEPLRRTKLELERAERVVRLVRHRLAGEAVRLRELRRILGRVGHSGLRLSRDRTLGLGRRLSAAAPRGPARARQARRQLAERLAALMRSRLREATVRLEGYARLCAGLGPQRTLERGFSITRDRSGVILRRPRQVAARDLVFTQLAYGTVTSRVEET